jgi:ataxin-10
LLPQSALLGALIICLRFPHVQDEVCALGGVELVLAQCQLDRQSPLAREWALWAVRNLCEGNEQAQVGRHLG